MKKTIIGALVGGLLIFIWQTLSWTALDLHRPSQDYTAKQDTIMAFLSSNLEKEGGYLLPNVPKGTSMEEATKAGEKMMNKPWASIQYHSAFTTDMNAMYMNMARGFVVNILLACLACWLFGKMNHPSFTTIFFGSLVIGIIVFLNTAYTQHIWYKSFDLYAHLSDALVSWGAAGLWFGWWLRKP